MTSESDKWIPDKQFGSCQLCNLRFLFVLRRRHHCRECGKVVQICTIIDWLLKLFLCSWSVDLVQEEKNIFMLTRKWEEFVMVVSYKDAKLLSSKYNEKCSCA